MKLNDNIMVTVGIYLNSFKVNNTMLFSIVGNLGCSKQKNELYFLQQSMFFHGYTGHTSMIRKGPLIN